MHQSVWGLELVCVGAVPPALMREVAGRLRELLSQPVDLLPMEIDGRPAMDLLRRQYSATGMLDLLKHPAPRPHVKRVGITSLDLFLPVFTHLFGYAQMGGSVAVVSTFRIAPENGAEPGLLLDRIVKEVLHEIGHTVGLVHCRAPWCVMHPSRWPEEIDLKDAAFCSPCASVINKTS